MSDDNKELGDLFDRIGAEYCQEIYNKNQTGEPYSDICERLWDQIPENQQKEFGCYCMFIAYSALFNDIKNGGSHE